MFSELYSAYYNAVAEIIKRALNHPLQKNEIRTIVEEYAFGESVLNIEPALKEERWQLLYGDGTTPIKKEPTMPPTVIQKRWAKAISLDPRIQLFQEEPLEFPEVEPLFLPEDICIFDRYSDGDDYENEQYQANFRLILDAIRNHYPLKVHATNRKAEVKQIVILPEYLEYSEKDDKFRVIGSGLRFSETINLGRITYCERYHESVDTKAWKKKAKRTRSVIFELIDERNALERVLLHFAHFEKQAEKIDEKHYKVTVRYEKDDETEILIRILAFGPMVRVIAPQHFINLIKVRLLRQMSCEQ